MAYHKVTKWYGNVWYGKPSVHCLKMVWPYGALSEKNGVRQVSMGHGRVKMKKKYKNTIFWWLYLYPIFRHWPQITYTNWPEHQSMASSRLVAPRGWWYNPLGR